MAETELYHYAHVQHYNALGVTGQPHHSPSRPHSQHHCTIDSASFGRPNRAARYLGDGCTSNPGVTQETLQELITDHLLFVQLSGKN